MRTVKSKFSLSFGCTCGKKYKEKESFLYIQLPLFLIDSYFFQSFGEKSYFLLRENPNSFSFLSNCLQIELSSDKPVALY